jgi:type I restriction enzyme R subunit
LSRPADWSPQALVELRKKLTTAPERFTIDLLQKAHDLRYHKALVDVISMVKHAAKEQEPLLTAAERVERAFAQIKAGRLFTPEQEQWLGRIREHLIANLSIDEDDFENIPVLQQAGGWGKANRVFRGELKALLRSGNQAVAA